MLRITNLWSNANFLRTVRGMTMLPAVDREKI